MDQDPSSPSAPPGAPLLALHAQMGDRRILHLLLRAGYRTVEEVDAVPDAKLRDLPRMSVQAITELRNAIAVFTGRDRRHRGGPLTLNADQATELATLLSLLSSYARGYAETEVADRAQALLDELFDG